MPNQIKEKASITVPWRELALKDYADTGGEYAYDGSSKTQHIEVAWADENQALVDILGTQWAEREVLYRTPPLQHPETPWLFATRCKTQNVKLSQTDKPFKNTYGRSATYGLSRIHITYQTLSYNPVWYDSRYVNEWNRCVASVPHPTSDAFSLPSRTMGYVEGSPLPNPQGINYTTQKITGRSDIVWTWFNVPNDYLMDPFTSIPSNIQGYKNPVAALNQTPDGAIGRVNFTDFAGFPAGTLLCMPPLITPRMAPVPYNDQYYGDTQVRLWNVQFTFKYYDPPLGPGCKTRGHNTAIWPGDFLSYATKSQTPAPLVGPQPNTYTGAPQYLPYEFANIFKACDSLQLLPNA